MCFLLNVNSRVTASGIRCILGLFFSAFLSTSVLAQTSNALDFDGSNDKVTIPDNNVFDMTTNYTLEAWIYPTQFKDLAGIISKYQTSGANGFMLRIRGTSGQVAFDDRPSTNNVLTLNAWNHIAAVNNNGTRTLYINGAPVALGSSSATVAANSDPIRIGIDYNDNNRCFKGRIDEVRIWNTARTASEITANMQSRLVGNETGLVAYYPFDQGTAGGTNTGLTTLTNLTSTTGINGTLENFALTGNTSNWVAGVQKPEISYGGSPTYTFTAGSAISPVNLSNTGGTPDKMQVSTLAGKFNGYADATGTRAKFSLPVGVALDGSGNLYVADEGNHRIRKIVISTGEVTTVAGSGAGGYADGTGTAASFNRPASVALDGSGNLFVADWGNHCIRKVVISTGVVTTLAGSTDPGYLDASGSSARFVNPYGVAVDGSGNLYVADYGNNKIRQIVISSGSVTTLAGGEYGYSNGTGTSARFSYPIGLALDGSGNLYVADHRNHAIRRIVISSRVVSTLAGDGTQGSANGTGTSARFNFPTGVSLDGSGNLYVADLLNQRIRKIVISTGVVTTLAGTGIVGSSDGTLLNASFSNPHGVAVDGSGNLYVADKLSYRIRMVSDYRIEPELPAGLFFDARTGTISGTPTAAQAAKVYTVYAQNVMGSATAQVTIGVASAPTVATSAATNILATSATLNGTVNANGGATSSITIKYSTSQSDVDAGNGTSATVTPTNATGSTVTSISANITGLTPATTYYFRISATNATGTNNGSTLSFTTTEQMPSITYGSSSVTWSVGTAITPLTITHSGGAVVPQQVFTLAGSGIIGNTNGTGTNASFNGAANVAVDGSGNLFVADQSNHRIRKVVISTGEVTTLAGSTQGYADGTGTNAKFFFPMGVAADGNGNLYVSDYANHRIRKIVISTGEVTTLAGSTQGHADATGTSAKFSMPAGIAVDNSGDLYVVDMGNNRIRKVVVATRDVTTLAGGTQGFDDGTGTSAKFTLPSGVAFDGSGNLFIADQRNNRIRKIVISSGVVTTIAGSSLGNTDGTGSNALFWLPTSIALDGAGNLYVTDQLNRRIRKIVISTGAVTTVAGSTAGYADGTGSSAKFYQPIGIVADATGNLFVSDNGNQRIRKISKYSISPALPAGLSFNTATGDITGTPTALSPATTYTITASNGGGTATTTISLEVSSSLLTTDVSTITETTATSGGTVDATEYAGATQKGVCWNTTGTPTSADSKTEEGSGTGTFTSSMTGLTANTTYYVRAYVIVGSTTTYGSQKTFKTNELGAFADITKTYGDADFSLTAPTAVSTGAFSYSSSNTGVATVSGGMVTITGAGSSTITATQAASGAYASLTRTLTLTVNPATPTITLNVPTTSTLAAANNMPITATASNGETVTIAIGSGTATGTLTPVSAGSYTLGGVSATGNLVFNATTAVTATHAAGSKTVTMDVTKNNQTITFASLSPVTFSTGLTQTLTATTSATGLTVSFDVVSGPGSIAGNTLTITGPGTILIKASQAGDGTYNIAPDVERSLTVNPATPVITSFTPTSATEGETVTITGQYFQNVSAVSFGGTAATSFNVVSATQITAVLGTGHTGVVSVTTTGGTDTEPGFRYKVTWTGATNAFNTASNWSGSRVPQTDDDIIFSATAASDLELDASKTVGNVDFNGSGRSIKLGAYNLTVKGNLSMPGNITGSGKLIMGGTTAQTIRGGGIIPDLEINNSAGVTIDATGDELTVSGTLRSTSGTLTTNGKLRLTSNSSGTARVGVVGGSISGNVIAERYVQQNQNSGGTGRAWRLVSVPVTGTGTLRDFFMNGRNGQDLTLTASRDAESENSGTPIVGHNYTTASEANTAGFDWIGVANQVSSLRYYTGSAGGGSFASENVPTMTTTYSAADQGYMVFSRGDRKLEFPSTTSAGATTFRSTGALKTGNQSVTIQPASTSKFTLVGNPYMSVLDLSALYTSNSSVIEPSFWIWDANMAGTNYQGGYVNVYLSGSQWVTNTGSYINPELIESGMAFFAEPKTTLSAAGTLTIMESHKSTATSAGLSPFATDDADDHGRMYVRLERADDKGQRQLIDGVMADFHSSFKTTLSDLSDREKLRNGISRGALWLKTENKLLSSEGLPWPKTDKRSIPLYMSGVGDQTLIVRIDPRGMRDRYVQAWLKDNVLKRQIEINMNAPTDYDFIGTGSAAWDSTRFEIVYVEAGRPSTGVTLEPDDAAEAPSVKLYPNPSKSADVKLSLRAMTPGTYSIQVLDMTGRLVATTGINHRSLNGEYRILEGRRLSPGKYIIRLSQSGTPVQTLQLIHE